MILVPEHEQRVRLVLRNQLQRRLQHGHAGALRADEGASNVESLLRKELIEVVTGYAPRNVDEALADYRGIPVAQCRQLGRQLARAGPFDLPARHTKSLTAIGQHFQRVDVVGGPRTVALEGRLHRMHPAGVVADVSSDRAVAVRRRIRSEDETSTTCALVHLFIDRSGLSADETRSRVGLSDPRQMPGAVDHNGLVDRLTGEARARAARQERRAVLATDGVHGDDVFDRLRKHDADRNLPVVRSIVRVERPVLHVEANVAFDRALEVVLQAATVDRFPFSRSAHRSASAMIGSAGFAAPCVGNTDPSTT